MNKPLPRSKFGRNYDKNFDRIFGKKKRPDEPEEANDQGVVGPTEETPAEGSPLPARDAL